MVRKIWMSGAVLFTLLFLLTLTFRPAAYAITRTPIPTQGIPTPLPRVYSQTEINNMLVLIEERYGVGFSYPTEWQAVNASEIMWFTDGLHQILEALDIASFYLYLYGDPPEDVTPLEFFRLHFDQANLEIDRSVALVDNFAGNTLPRYGNGEVIGYTIQLTGVGMSNPFTLIHELGHVVDGLLADRPHEDFVTALGGEWASDRWLPGQGYRGNEAMFPRATGGPNEDFADTFGQMLLGNLGAVRVRYDFMLAVLPEWLAAIRALKNEEM